VPFASYFDIEECCDLEI